MACNVFAEGDAAAGQAMYLSCPACHGANGEGNKALNAPKLAGQEEWYLVRQIQNFKKGIRGGDPKDMYGAQMAPMVATLIDDKAISDVAAYIATFESKPSKTTVTGDAAKGETGYGVCKTCHGEKAEGKKEMNAPRLAGMDDWYQVTQLKNFKAGIRGKHPDDTYGAQMQPMAMILADDQAIADVVAYINTLQ
jgi:cytochrome c oxidase subunit 2